MGLPLRSDEFCVNLDLTARLNMKPTSSGPFLRVCFGIAAIFAVSGCSIPLFRFGVGGRYLEAKEEITRPQGGKIDKAILNLEGIVRENPTYEDSLTLLGRAYYKKGRYQDAYLILQRALAVNKEDEIAWMVLGLAQMRLGQDQKALDSIKGGITLLSKAMSDNYRGFSGWDRQGTVRTSARRSIFLATKGLEEKENLMRSIELLIGRIDEEEWQQGRDRAMERITETGP